jgi:RNase H-like domain found in reverse transcriptase
MHDPYSSSRRRIRNGLGDNANNRLSMGSRNVSHPPQSSSSSMMTCLTGWRQTAQMLQPQKSPEDDKWHSITFYSKSLTPVERNYEIHNKEMLAIVWALEEWRHFLKGSKHQIGNMDRP